MGYVTGAELQGHLNIEDLPSKFQVANQDAGIIADVLLNADATLTAHMSFKHMKFETRFDGFRLTTCANEGQTAFTIPAICRNVSPTESYVWVNLCGAYRDRDKHDSVTFTISGDNATLTLDEPLSEGDTVVADFVYSGANRPQILKKLALDLAVQDIITRKPSLCLDPMLRENYRENHQHAMAMLTKLKAGRLLIPEWENLDLVPENRAVSPEGPGTLIVGW